MSEFGDSVSPTVETPPPSGTRTPDPAPEGAGAGDTPSATVSPSTTPGTPNTGSTFKAQFRAFSKFGDTKSDGRQLTLFQSDKWMKQAKVIDNKKISTTDTGIYFKKFKAHKLAVEEYKKFLEDLAKNKKVDFEEMKTKLASCGAPGLTCTALPAKAVSTVDRLTDASRYTGAHKQRFDESGKGRGMAGRKDQPDGSGYVQGYQNKDTYSKSH